MLVSPARGVTRRATIPGSMGYGSNPSGPHGGPGAGPPDWRTVLERAHALASSTSAEDADEALRLIARLVDEAGDDGALAAIGSGPLETLLVNHALSIAADVESAATSSPAFAKALGGVWLAQLDPPVALRLAAAAAQPSAPGPGPPSPALAPAPVSADLAAAAAPAPGSQAAPGSFGHAEPAPAPPPELALTHFFDYKAAEARGERALDAHPGAAAARIIDRLTGAPDSASSQALWFIVLDLVGCARGDDELAVVGSGPLQALVNGHAEMLTDRMEEAAAGSSKMRTALRHVRVTADLPDHVSDRVHRLVDPGRGTG